MGIEAMPLWSACLEKPLRLPSTWRGTPRPAESLRKTNEPCESAPDWTSVLWFTLMSEGCWPTRVGRVGTLILSPLPDLTAGDTAAMLLSPIHEPPGIHPQPVPGQNDHDP